MRILVTAVAGWESLAVVGEQVPAWSQVLTLVPTRVQMMALIGVLAGPRIRVWLAVLELDPELVMIEQVRVIGPQMMIGAGAGY